jgi:hypothetical protein
MEEVIGGMGALSVIVGSHDCTSQLTNIASSADTAGEPSLSHAVVRGDITTPVTL